MNDTSTGAATGAATGGTEDGARDGSGPTPLHDAAREAIAAARRLLDAADEMLADPAAVSGVVTTIGDVVKQFTAGLVDAARTPETGDDTAPGDERSTAFERIPVD